MPSVDNADIDDLDRQIIAMLRDDPQVSNKAIAQRAAVSETTIATRIRNLTNENLIRVTALRDIFATGVTIVAHVDVHVARREVSAVAAELAQLEDITSVATLVGSPQLIVQIHARDRDHLLQVVEGSLSGIAGIERIEVNISMQILKYRPDVAALRTST